MNLSFLFKNNYYITFLNQLVVSGSNFLITILLIKFSSIELFAQYSFIWLINYFILGLNDALISSPMYSIYPKILKEKKSFFLGSIFFSYLIFILISFLLCILILLIFPKLIKLKFDIIEIILISLSIAAFQTQNFIKKVLYCINFNLLGLIGDLISYSILLSLIIFLLITANQSLDLINIFTVYIFAFLTGCIFITKIYKKLNFSLSFFISNSKTTWKISKWLALGNIASWFTHNFWIIISAPTLGTYIYGVLKSLNNIVGFFNIFFQALEYVVPQKISEKFETTNSSNVKRYILKFTSIGTIFGILFLTLIYFFGDSIIVLFLNQDLKIYKNYLFILTLLYFFQFYTFPVNYILRSLNYTFPIFIYLLFSCFFSLIFYDYFVNQFSINGIFWGIAISNGIVLIGTFFSAISMFKKFYKK